MKNDENPKKINKSKLKKAISKIEMEFEEYEREERAEAEKIFYSYLKLSEKPTVEKFFDKIKAHFDVKWEVFLLFCYAHPVNEKTHKKGHTRLHAEISAFDAYIWLRNLNPVQLIECESVAFLGNKNIVRNFIDKIDYELAKRLDKYHRKKLKNIIRSK